VERLLNEAISTVDAAEREKKQSRSKQQDNDSAAISATARTGVAYEEQQTMALWTTAKKQVDLMRR
jgi:hypothetical protein